MFKDLAVLRYGCITAVPWGCAPALWKWERKILRLIVINISPNPNRNQGKIGKHKYIKRIKTTTIKSYDKIYIKTMNFYTNFVFTECIQILTHSNIDFVRAHTTMIRLCFVNRFLFCVLCLCWRMIQCRSDFRMFAAVSANLLSMLLLHLHLAHALCLSLSSIGWCWGFSVFSLYLYLSLSPSLSFCLVCMSVSKPLRKFVGIFRGQFGGSQFRSIYWFALSAPAPFSINLFRIFFFFLFVSVSLVRQLFCSADASWTILYEFTTTDWYDIPRTIFVCCCCLIFKCKFPCHAGICSGFFFIFILVLCVCFGCMTHETQHWDRKRTRNKKERKWKCWRLKIQL